MSFLADFGCIACYLDGHMAEPCCVHHLVSGNRRMGHAYTIGLCPSHHTGAVSVHMSKKQFVAKYGTELELWQWLRNRYESYIHSGSSNRAPTGH